MHIIKGNKGMFFTVVTKGFWTPHVLVMYCIVLDAVYFSAFTHMLHVHCSIRLRTGCFSKMTLSLAAYPGYQNCKNSILLSEPISEDVTITGRDTAECDK